MLVYNENNFVAILYTKISIIKDVLNKLIVINNNILYIDNKSYTRKMYQVCKIMF